VLHPGATRPRRGRGVPDRATAGCADTGVVRRGRPRPHARGLPIRLGEGGVLRRKRVGERLPLLRGHVAPEPGRRARVGQAQGNDARVGAARLVTAAARDHGGGGHAGALAVRAPPGHPARCSMSAFPPHLLDRRLRVARAVVGAIMGLIVVVFFVRQILEHGKYRLQSELIRLRPITLPAPRGLIMDRNGKVLAENVPGYTVSLLPGDQDSLRAVLRRLAPLVKLDEAEIGRVLTRYRRAPYLPVMVLPNAKFELVSALEERRVIFPGLLIQPE